MRLPLASHRTSSRTVGLSVLAAAALLMSACGSSDEGSGASLSADKVAAAKASASEAEKTPAKITQTVPLSKAAPKGKLVVFIADPAAPSQEVYSGVKEAAEAVGWTSKVVKFDPTDLSTFNAALLQALSLGADYVVDGGIPESQLSKSTVAKYKAAGVPIVVSDTTPVPATDTLLGMTSGSNSRISAGHKLGDWFIADSKGKGKAVVVNITTYPTLTLFADSFTSYVKKECPACKTQAVKVTFGDALDGTLTTNTIAKLRADRSIKYAVFDNSGEINGFDAALKAAGLNDVKVLGHGIDPVARKSLVSGAAQAFVAYNYKFNGYEAVDVALRHSVGDPVKDDKVVTPFQLITKSNVKELSADAVFQAPTDALEQFKKLWLVDPAS